MCFVSVRSVENFIPSSLIQERRLLLSLTRTPRIRLCVLRGRHQVEIRHGVRPAGDDDYDEWLTELPLKGVGEERGAWLL